MLTTRAAAAAFEEFFIFEENFSRAAHLGNLLANMKFPLFSREHMKNCE
jgi:hypothetical protein